jgi:flagellar basal body rod protein FlgG
MDPLLISAASGMKARMESLDMLANNIANSGTAGFKADREFYNLYEQELPLVENRWTDFSQGSMLPTGNPLNLALSGKGFFALNGPGGTVYTRNGNFRVSKNNQLETPDGYTLRNSLDQGRPIKVDPAQEVSIGKDGTVTQAGLQIGRIEIGEIPSAADAVRKLGNSYFALISGAGSAAPAQSTEVMQGQLEQSNVPVADSAVRLVNVMRQFEMLQKAMNISSEMSKEVIQEIARVN